MENSSNWPYIVALFPGVIALIIVIWRNWLETLFFHPKLNIYYDQDSSDITNIPTTVTITIPNPPQNEPGVQIFPNIGAYYFRFRVKNDGNITAKDVEVFVQQLQERREDGNFSPRKGFIPLNLNWSHMNEIYFPLIPPQMERHCDLGHIYDPNGGRVLPGYYAGLSVDEGNTVFAIGFKVRPNVQSTFKLEPHTYKFHLLVSASNVKQPKAYEVELHFSGEWHRDKDDMLKKGVGLKFEPV